ncbi:hypothetical protein [Allokutzneria oryzae]|uniref:Uncharacterized protein n=1 Tax=Allokutzneria oryzae TaxID=1378989 RepID=A0ABV6A8A0_9PSEU
MTDTSNQNSGSTTGPTTQIGTVTGSVTINEAPKRAQWSVPLVIVLGIVAVVALALHENRPPAATGGTPSLSPPSTTRTLEVPRSTRNGAACLGTALCLYRIRSGIPDRHDFPIPLDSTTCHTFPEGDRGFRAVTSGSREYKHLLYPEPNCGGSPVLLEQGATRDDLPIRSYRRQPST